MRRAKILLLVLGLSLVSSAASAQSAVTLYDKARKVIEQANPLPVQVQSGGLSAASPTYTNVVGAASDTVLLAANSARKPNSVIVNDSTAILYIKLAASGSSSTSYYVAVDGKTSVSGVFQIPDNYVGAICGTWASATGSARVTEMQ